MKNVTKYQRPVSYTHLDVYKRQFLNFLSEYDERILLTFNATEHKIKAS